MALQLNVQECRVWGLSFGTILALRQGSKNDEHNSVQKSRKECGWYTDTGGPSFKAPHSMSLIMGLPKKRIPSFSRPPCMKRAQRKASQVALNVCSAPHADVV